jgi:glucose/arabinose dehydrogenase
MANSLDGIAAEKAVTAGSAPEAVSGVSRPAMTRMAEAQVPNVIAGPDLIPGYDPNGPNGLSGVIMATRVATFFTQPVFAGAPPGDPSRLFIVERGGAIKIIELDTGQVLSTPFLDLSAETETDGERGLLGLAFDPNFATNGYFYVDVSNKVTHNTDIRRYQVSSDPNVANPASAFTLLSINQSEFNNHKGGWLGFGPDGDLYISVQQPARQDPAHRCG